MLFTCTLCFSLVSFVWCWLFLHLLGCTLGLEGMHRARATQAMCAQEGSASTPCGNILFILFYFLLSF